MYSGLVYPFIILKKDKLKCTLMNHVKAGLGEISALVPSVGAYTLCFKKTLSLFTCK